MALNSSAQKIIAVFGSSGITQDSEAAKQAYHLGRRLAESGLGICNGGYMGVMEAVSRGAADAGGTIIGVTCSAFSRRSPNPYLTQEIPTSDLLERISTLLRLADAYIVLDGNIGTLAELFLAWNLRVTGGSKPVLVVGENLRNALQALQSYTEIDDSQLRSLTFLPSVERVCEFLYRHFQI